MSEHHRTPQWQTITRVHRPRIKATLPAACIDCGRAVMPTDRWQVGHIVSVVEGKAMGWTRQQLDHPSNLGPSHAKAPGQKACNQIAGGKLGAKVSTAKAAARRETTKRMPSW